MKKEWFSTVELIGIGGLPSTTQGVNLKAKREDWKSRKRAGIQGRALEYHITSLPKDTQTLLQLSEKENLYLVNENDYSKVWFEAYKQLTVKEREILITYIMRFGIRGLVKLIPEG